MSDPLSLAAGVAGLISLTLELGHTTHGYISGIRDATKSQRRYLREVLALSEVLARLDDALQEAQVNAEPFERRSALSEETLLECRSELEKQKIKLSKTDTGIIKHARRLLWPFQEKEIKKAVDELHRFHQIFADFVTASTSDNVVATLRHVQNIKHDQARHRLLERLHVPPEVLRRPPEPLDGTGAWFCSSATFQDWITGPPSTLCCYGAPGAGKSALAVIAAKHLPVHHSKTAVSFFADYTRRQKQTDVIVLQSLLHQLALQLEGKALDELMQSCNDTIGDEMYAPDLACIFEKCCHEGLVIIFDGLDEFQNAKRLLSWFEKFRAAGCHIMITSRDLSESLNATQTTRIEIRAHDADLAGYIRHRFEETDVGTLVYEHHPLIQAIVKKSDGIFLLTRLLLDNLLCLPTLKKMRQALDASPDHIEQAYESTLQRISSQPRALRVLANRAFDWALHAKRPLRPVELIHAFAVEEGDEELDTENMTTVQIILRACAGLLVVDDIYGGLAFVHVSAYEFLKTRQSEDAAEEDIANTCLVYLQLGTFRQGACNTLNELNSRFNSFPFFDYAAHYWGEHIAIVESSERINIAIDRCLNDEGCRSSSFQALNHQPSISDDDVAMDRFASLPKDQSRLHVVAHWGLKYKIKHLIQHGDDVKVIDSQQWTALHWAASRSHSEAMEVLLEASAPIDAQDERGWTAAMWSSIRGDVKALKILLHYRANMSLKDVHGWNALRWAMSARQPLAVGTLQMATRQQISSAVANNAFLDDIKNIEESGRLLNEEKPVIEWAASIGSEEDFNSALVHFGYDHEYWEAMWARSMLQPPIGNLWRLQKKGMRERRQDIMSPNPWHAVEKKESVYAIRYPQNDKIDQNPQSIHPPSAEDLRGKEWRSALLCSAIKGGNLAAMKMLLNLGADPNHIHPADIGRSPLHIAAYSKDATAVRILIAYGADVTRKDDCGETPLHHAVLYGFEDSTAALLEGGSNVNERRGFQKDLNTPIKSNFLDDRFKIAKLKRPQGLNREISDAESAIGAPQDYRGRTSIMLACGYRNGDNNEKIIELLIRNGADLLCQDFIGQTLVHYAAYCSRISLATSAIKAGADVNGQDHTGKTALHVAFIHSSVRLVTALLSQGANPEITDHNGRHVVHGLEYRRLSDDTETTVFNLYQLVRQAFLQNSHSDSSASILHWAVSRGYWLLADALVKDGLRVIDTAILWRPTPLLRSIEDLRLDYVTLLAKRTSQREDLTYYNRDISNNLLKAMQRIKSQESLETFDQIMHVLHEGAFTWDTDSRTSLLLMASEKCDFEGLPRIMHKHGVRFFQPLNAPDDALPFGFISSGDLYRDACATAACLGNYRLLLGLIECAQASGHSPISTSQKETLVYESQDHALHCYCSMLSANNLIDEPVDGRMTPLLTVAVMQGNLDLVVHLLDHGADIHVKDRHNWQPIHWAVSSGHKSIVETLMDKGADAQSNVALWPEKDMELWSVPAADKCGTLSYALNALHIACYWAEIGAFECLLQHGIDIDMPPRVINHEATKGQWEANSSGEYSSFWTPLTLLFDRPMEEDQPLRRWEPYIERDRARLSIARMLLERGADPRGVGTSFRPSSESWKMFEGFEDVWDRLQAANKIAEESQSLPRIEI